MADSERKPPNFTTRLILYVIKIYSHTIARISAETINIIIGIVRATTQNEYFLFGLLLLDLFFIFTLLPPPSQKNSSLKNLALPYIVIQSYIFGTASLVIARPEGPWQSHTDLLLLHLCHYSSAPLKEIASVVSLPRNDV